MKRKRIISILVIIVLLTLLPLFIWALSQKYQTNKKAASSEPTLPGRVALSPLIITKKPGESFSASLNFRTGTEQSNLKAISAISLKFSYPYDQPVALDGQPHNPSPELDIVDANGNQVNQIYPNSNLLTGGDWTFPVNKVSRENGIVTIEFAAINTNVNGFSSLPEVPLATIYFKANRIYENNPIIISWDNDESKMLTKAEPVADILLYPAEGRYTIEGDVNPPATITDLQAKTGSSDSVLLTWTAPADDFSGLKNYDIRYSKEPISDSNFVSAIQIPGVSLPSSSGVSEQVKLTGLDSGVNYYFAIKSEDNFGNISQISNIAQGKTQESTLDFSIKFQGISKSDVQKQIDLSFKNPDGLATLLNRTVVSANNGIFKPPFPTTIDKLLVPQAGVLYSVSAKDNTHLNKTLGSINIKPGANIAPNDWLNSPLKAGDFDNNNVLNIIDVGKMISAYTSLSTPVNSNNKTFDIDENGVINILDIATVLANYTGLEVKGDE